MSRKTFGAGALASAFVLVLALIGAESSGAAAQQDAGAGIESDHTAAQDAANTAETADSSVRFVAEAVVQPLPEPTDIVDQETVASGEASSLHELVADMPTSAALSDDLRCLAQAIYFESRGEPLAGQLAVGRVVVNRAESSLFPDSYCGVVKQRKQFSFVKNGHIPAVRTSSTAWQRAMAVARIAHEELWESAAGDSLYFHAKRVHPRWARRKIAETTIDSHIFYR
ncbi:spore germination cell wall hydrolase CwlJ-like protein [Altererythrobacter atlanticus]|uniref:Spore cortex-lytic enzyme n=1 Tax=Croceibacterium atlanticum TaxID=1267766 RepID=A0A0F7KVU1_9SPHN|nr:cell wall hydrolase [Croceibacterium atlanticum]AKH43322.1 Spore cortex-lytic enzyme precursor [Croceibacterium atlanticum]MBB5731972.1 spore germination cell wall hydrolase CwlJ-like protein [Croceibacterium atlanticum]